MTSEIEKLRDDLRVVFEQLKSGELEPGQAKEMNNAAGKIIGTLKVQLEYASLRGDRPKIAFLDS